MTINVFVLGLDDFHRERLATVRDAEQYAFHGLLPVDELSDAPSYDIADLLERAERHMRELPERADAVVGYFDFPVSTMLPILRQRFGMPTTSFESVLRCEHKYWSRLEQAKVVPDHIPRFQLIDPLDDGAVEKVELEYPFWLKPIKSLGSFLGFRVGNSAQLKAALATIRERIGRIAEPFEQLLADASLPEEVSRVPSHACLAEQIIGGRQCTLEGYRFQGKTVVYGVVDSIRLPNKTSFARYQYPSGLPQRVQQRMIEVVDRFLEQIKYEDSPFNAELFWDERRDQVWLLEVNTRISQSHCTLFENVHGASHQEVMLDLALGREPNYPWKNGPHRLAGKFMARYERDAIVTRVPSEHDIRQIREEIPGLIVQLRVFQGMRLGHLEEQDSYTYEIAAIHIGASNQKQLLERYRRCVERLDIRFEDFEAPPRRKLAEKKNVFLIGLNEFNRQKLDSIPEAERFGFHGLLDYSDITDQERYPLQELLGKARKQLDDFDGSVDAIVAYMDFPVSTMVPILCRERGLPAVSLEALLACEHKYWSRLEQQKVIPRHIPEFRAFNPFDDDPRGQIDLPYPFWVKPVKSWGSYLGFRVASDADFERAMRAIRREIGRVAEPFNEVLKMASLPDEVAPVDGYHCLAESLIGGQQCTLEGYVIHDHVHFHGVVDSVRYPHRSSFSRYQYPSRLPAVVQRKMKRVAARAVWQTGLRRCAFNVELFWDEKKQRVFLLEINPRVAQHHSDLFEKVDGCSNHEAAVEVALGREPRLPHRRGDHACAAVFFMREFEDGRVVAVPSARQIDEVQKQFPGTIVEVGVEPGQRLSDLKEQDSYSYICGNVYVGATNTRALLEKYREVTEVIKFRFERPSKMSAMGDAL